MIYLVYSTIYMVKGVHMDKLTQELDDLLENALNLKDFIQTIRDAVCYNADESKDGTHVLFALDYFLAEFKNMTNKIEDIGFEALKLKL